MRVHEPTWTPKGLINAVQALEILHFYDPAGRSKPNTRQLLPYVNRGDLSRIRVKGKKYWYKKTEVENLFLKIAN